MGCTLAELDQRMTSEEFSLHQALWAVEPSGPYGSVQQWAALMAAIVNGPLVRKNKRRFTAEDFWPASAWAEQDEPREPQMVTRGKKPMLAPDLSGMRGMRVNNSRKR